MDTDREKLALERKLANYRELAREFPDENWPGDPRLH
jgi:hypothetical protein